jgi:hypothetical protein
VRLWDEEARRSPAARVELLTLVALVSEPELFERAQQVVTDVARAHPSRTIVVRWATGGERAITADVALHRGAGGVACGDALVVEATGGARKWLPENIDRLALPDLPVCIWWVGDLPDYDRLFDRMLVDANLVIVNSGEMDLRDLEKLSSIVLQSRGRCRARARHCALRASPARRRAAGDDPARRDRMRRGDLRGSSPGGPERAPVVAGGLRRIDGASNVAREHPRGVDVAHSLRRATEARCPLRVQPPHGESHRSPRCAAFVGSPEALEAPLRSTLRQEMARRRPGHPSRLRRSSACPRWSASSLAPPTG